MDARDGGRGHPMTTPTGRDLDGGLARQMGLELREMPAFHSPADATVVAAEASLEQPEWFILDCGPEHPPREAGPVGQAAPWWPHYRLCWRAVPEYHRSLDALFAPGGPVEYAWNKGMAVELSNWTQGWLATVGQDGRGNQMRPTAAEALATALHEAFMKEQGQ